MRNGNSNVGALKLWAVIDLRKICKFFIRFFYAKHKLKTAVTLNILITYFITKVAVLLRTLDIICSNPGTGTRYLEILYITIQNKLV